MYRIGRCFVFAERLQSCLGLHVHFLPGVMIGVIGLGTGPFCGQPGGSPCCNSHVDITVDQCQVILRRVYRQIFLLKAIAHRSGFIKL